MYLNDLFEYKESRYSFRKTNIVDVPQVRTTYHGLHSFRFAGATLILIYSTGLHMNYYNLHK
jgi:hypothetical protein